MTALGAAFKASRYGLHFSFSSANAVLSRDTSDSSDHILLDKEIAALENYKAKIADNKAIPIYNKYYKRYSARVKVRQIKEADFKKWKYQAMSKRDECTDGIITPEKFTERMENSFPNRKPKS